MKVVERSVYLCGGLYGDGVVGLDGGDPTQLDVKEEENEAIQRRTQSVTETPNSCYHALNQTWGNTTHSLYSQYTLLIAEIVI